MRLIEEDDELEWKKKW